MVSDIRPLFPLVKVCRKSMRELSELMRLVGMEARTPEMIGVMADPAVAARVVICFSERLKKLEARAAFAGFGFGF